MLPLACIIAPLIAGQIADQWLAVKWILMAAHLIGAVLIYLAASQTKFWNLLGMMFAYSMCYAATMPLVNAALFENVKDVETQGKVFIWAPVAWALVGWSLSAWRWKFKTEGEGKDGLYLAAILSVVMGLSCLLLPANLPKQTGEIAIVQAFSTLENADFLVFMLISLAVAGMMQFYFVGSPRFMIDAGIPAKNTPGAMAIAQAVQAVATFFLLGLCLEKLGFKWTMTIGVTCWLLQYAIYIATKPQWLIVAGQSLHGLAYVLFIIVGQIYAEKVGGPEIRSSMQALIFAATTGVGLFLGTQLTGIVMDRFSVNGKFDWRKVWIVPGAIILVGVLALALLFKGA
jgi:MFS family permease